VALLGSAGEGDAQGQPRLRPHAWAMAAWCSAFEDAGGCVEEQERWRQQALLHLQWRCAAAVLGTGEEDEQGSENVE
jgi:hypothetical protein